MDIHGSPTGLRLRPCQLEVTVKRNAGHGSLQLQSGATHRQRPRDSQRPQKHRSWQRQLAIEKCQSETASESAGIQVLALQKFS